MIVRSRVLRSTLAAPIAASLLTLSACTEVIGLGTGTASGKTGAKVQQAATQFPDVPLPTGARMDANKTFVFGSAGDWFGQITLVTSHDAGIMFDFYKQKLPEYGWREITSVRAPTSVLTYSRDERILAILIEGSTLRGSDVTLTVSPRGVGVDASAPATPPPVLPGPVETVP